MSDYKDQVEKMFEEAVDRLGVKFDVKKERLADYIVERSAHLSSLVGDPGFEIAAKAEARALALETGLNALDVSEAADAELRGMITAAIRLGITAV